MCGINGFYNYSNISLPHEESLLAKMNTAIQHRGPDDKGIWAQAPNGIFLGHRRLSILDLSSNGHQPMVGKNGNAIVYNGEVYNYRDLKKRFVDHQFCSETDTEVLLYMYDKLGDAMLNELNGMFAFAIWDQDKQELFLARDRVGIKPLYYTTFNGVFAFSSEIKALLELPWVRAELDEEAFYDFLTFGKLCPPQTMFKDIHKFHPGYKMLVGENGIEMYQPHWEIAYSNFDNLSEADLSRIILDELRQSVSLRMVSDVPVGAFLSGGVDSSAIVALMNRSESASIKTFSIGFENAPGYDELVYARKVAKEFGTDHHEKMVTPKDMVEVLPQIIELYDEPLIDPTAIPIFFISQLARQHGVYVILTGDGPDELFAGYRSWMRYIRLYPYYRMFTKLPSGIKKAMLGSCKRIAPSSPYFEILYRASKNQEFFWGGAKGFKEGTKSTFLSERFLNSLESRDSYGRIDYFRTLYDSISKNGRTQSDVDWLCFVGFKDLIPNFYLYRTDRLGMGNSIEIRVPYLDHNFVHLALSIGARWKTNNREPKYILKRSLESILSRETLYRKKQGFCVPIREWAGDFLVDYVEKNLAKFCRQTGLFNEQNLKSQVEEFKNGNINYMNAIWTIYFLMSWFKKWLL